MPQQNDHVLESHMCRSNDVLDGLICRRKMNTFSKVIYAGANIWSRPLRAGNPPKAQPVKLPPTTRGCLQTPPICQKYEDSRQGKTLQRTRVCLVLESALPISNPIARGMPPVPGVARAVKIKSSQINRNRTNQLRAEDASRFPLPASRFPHPRRRRRLPRSFVSRLRVGSGLAALALSRG